MGIKKTVCLLGIRADESLQRYRGFLNRKCGYQNTCWISSQFKKCGTASPMYDWTTSDVWHANAVFHYDYNRLYDLYHMAGLRPSQMRVASPFNDYAKESLNLYRVIDPQIWVKLVGRVQGANFAAIYGKKARPLATETSPCPRGTPGSPHTRFLLATLPARLRKSYGRNSKPPSTSGTPWAVVWRSKPSRSWKNTATTSAATACPTTLS